METGLYLFFANSSRPCQLAPNLYPSVSIRMYGVVLLWPTVNRPLIQSIIINHLEFIKC